MRGAAARQDNPDFLSLWAGQGVRLCRGGSAKALVEALVEETTATLRALAPG
jgi:nitronate monooxygenase